MNLCLDKLLYLGQQLRREFIDLNAPLIHQVDKLQISIVDILGKGKGQAFKFSVKQLLQIGGQRVVLVHIHGQKADTGAEIILVHIFDMFVGVG